MNFAKSDLIKLMNVIITFINVHFSQARPVDYVAPVNPCRLEDEFCSVKCVVLQLKGDVMCDFCVCANRSDYVKWDTTPGSTQSSFPTTTLPPDVIEVNNIRYHKVKDPCDRPHDGVCPMKCTELQQVKEDGSLCTFCDCKGTTVLLG